jgi:eukaryotic-like serine/threonine-protein kinase
MSLCINPTCPAPVNVERQLFCNQCGSELLIAGRFRVLGILGEGGFAKIYDAIDLDQRGFALKVLSQNIPKHMELFHREVQALSEINDSGVPAVEQDAYFTVPLKSKEQLHCLAMEKIAGLNLKNYVSKRERPISQAIAVRWMIQLSAILRSVHAHHFVHRDIKPTNIMLRSDGQLFLIDFGTVSRLKKTLNGRHSSDPLTRVSCALYTPDEQKQGNSVPQSDFFALGRTFIHLLTGQDLDLMHSQETAKLAWRDNVPNLCSQLANFLEELTAPCVSERPADADSLLKRLKEIQQELDGAFLFSSLPEVSYISSSRETELEVSELVQSSLNPDQLNLNNVAAATPAAEDSLSLLDPAFVVRCQQYLSDVLGPIATVICQRALSKKPHSEHELVAILSNQMTNGKHVQDFQEAFCNGFLPQSS